MIYDLLMSLRDGVPLKDVLPGILFTIIVVLLSLSLHEMCHAWAAYKMGDHTARNLGRLTLNPAVHLDFIGTACMLFFGFGWAKPVPVNSRNFRNPKRGIILTSLAGPISNLLLGFLFAVIYKFYIMIISDLIITSEQQALILMAVSMLLWYAISINVSLAVFNLFPVPPLDGSRFFYVFLPSKYYFGVMKYERYISIAIMVLLFVGVLDPILSFARNGITRLILNLVGF